jgi:hypothetical protein
MATYKIKMKYSFQCEWIIEAKNKQEAYEIADKHCGCVGPNYHTSISNDIVKDWVGDVHPNKSLISITR